MKRSTLSKLILAASALSFSSIAVASPVCTKEPQSKWMTPGVMKALVATKGYHDIKVFKVSGSCYEIYTHSKNGKREEVYFNPVTGAVVQSNVD